MEHQQSKKQRNQRRQRDNKNVDSEMNVKANKSYERTDSSKDVEPRPQRAHRRQQNEPKPSRNPVETPTTTESKREPVVEIAVDHSNLKKETEEIAKLTRKFNKREISSNWNRYSASQEVKDGGKTEVDAPADFSDLLQMPLSRGGHLQLKEEQDWSAVSGAELSGYFALDLKLLSQGLSCIPIHQQLGLPKHIFTEEEVQEFVSQANHYKTCYNTERTESLPCTQRLLSILVENTNNTPHLQDTSRTIAISKNTTSDSNGNIFVEEILQNRKRDGKIEPSNNKQEVSFGLDRLESSQLPEEREEKKPDVVDKNQAVQLVLSKPTLSGACDNLLTTSNKELSPDLQSSSVNNATAEKKETVLQTKLESLHLDDKSKIENFPTSQRPETDQKPPRVNRRNANSVEGVNSDNPVQSKDASLADDDDDDLDFLLSLKSPVSSQDKKDNNMTAIKESSFLPKASSISVTKATPAQQAPSELDDWLDSVLDD